MPEPLWIYLMALLYFTKVSTCSSIAEVFTGASHDRLTRMLNGVAGLGNTLESGPCGCYLRWWAVI
jgi:hypothetical protein